MIRSYEKLYSLDEEVGNPRLYVGACGNVCLSIDTTTFRVEHDKGVAKVSLYRYLTREQARELGEALVRFASEPGPDANVVSVVGSLGHIVPAADVVIQ